MLKEKQAQIETGRLDSTNTYSVNEIGWTMNIPEGWEVLTRKEVKAMNDKGKKTMQEIFDAEADISKVQPLISIKKDRLNIFTSNMEKVNEAREESYDDRIIATKEVLRTAYRIKNMKFVDEVGAKRIDGIMFDIFDLKIFAPDDDKKIILYQSIYSASINGYDFMMSITYNNKKHGETLMEIINSSKFRNRQ
jgi:hypothetical protein